ncbi:MAG: glutaminase [Bacteroidetes bacterium]|nr:glutaminase [Bacteroidota bacterium]
MDFSLVLNEIHDKLKNRNSEGKLAAYIPELAKVDPCKFGIHLLSTDGKEYCVGDYNEKFSIQSVSKVLSLSLVMSIIGEKVWDRIGVEPSGNPFNSIVQLEYEKGKPRNPFINAGALVLADILVTHLKDPKKEFLNYLRILSGNKNLQYNEKVAKSEKSVGYKNASLANMIKSYGNIENDVDVVLDFYFHQCSIEMTCAEMSKAFLPFATHGEAYHLPEPILTKSRVKRINAVMLSCGFYDESGEFAYKVGLPGKSGVGGGIVAVQPDQFSITVWSPKLNEKGNSVLGMKALELFTTKTGISIF